MSHRDVITLRNKCQKTDNIKVPKNSTSNMKWVGTYYKQIEKLINKTYKSESSLVIMFGLLAHILLCIDKNKYKDDARKYFLFSKQNNLLRDQKYDEGKFTEIELENLVNYPDFVS